MSEPKKVLQQMRGEMKSEWQNALQSPREILSLLRELARVFKDRWHRFAEINLQLAEQYLEQEELSDAILRFRFALWKQPQNADAWSGLGVALLKNGQRKKGVEALHKALQLAPGNARAAEALAGLSPPPAA